jgi:RNA ligase (TIGR02306 family)
MIDEIISIERVTTDSRRYDIEVEGNHNFFADGILVHNCQNLVSEIFSDDPEYEVTLKLDGSSVTYYHNNGEVGVCSRNLELKVNEENKDNTLIKVFHKIGLHHYLPKLGNIAIQGELMGPGIQGNRENLKDHEFFIFDIYDIDRGEYLTTLEREIIVAQLSNKVQHVPILFKGASLSELGLTSVEQLLKFAEGPSLNHPVREGLVFKRLDGKFSFKAISNLFLLKEKE